MTYATPADLLDRYEAELLAQRAAPEGVRVSGELLKLTVAGLDRSGYTAEEIAAADAAIIRMRKALDDAEELVNSHVSDEYQVPLSPLPPMIVRIVCAIARFFLFGDMAAKDGPEEREYLQSLKTLVGVRDRKLTLGAATKPAPAAEHQGAEVFGPERLFGRHTMRGL